MTRLPGGWDHHQGLARDQSEASRLPQVDRASDQFLDAVCDTRRRAILELLVPPPGQESPEDYEFRSGEMAQPLGLAPSTTSEHLHHLLNLHLVSARKEGLVVYYRLRNHLLVRAFHDLIQGLETHSHTTNGPLSEHPGVEGG